MNYIFTNNSENELTLFHVILSNCSLAFKIVIIFKGFPFFIDTKQTKIRDSSKSDALKRFVEERDISKYTKDHGSILAKCS